VSADFDDLAQLWREEPSAEEQRVLEVLARRASWEGRAVQHFDHALTLSIIIAVFLALLTSPTPATFGTGLLLAGAILWSSWKNHQLRQVALLVDTSNREALLESAWRATRARLRRSRLGMLLLVPGYLLGALAAYSYLNGNLEGFLTKMASHLSPTTRNGVLTYILLGGLLACLIRTHLKVAREVRNIAALQERYRAEAHMDLLSAEDKQTLEYQHLIAPTSDDAVARLRSW